MRVGVQGATTLSAISSHTMGDIDGIGQGQTWGSEPGDQMRAVLMCGLFQAVAWHW